MIVAAMKGAPNVRQHPDRLPVQSNMRDRGTQDRADENDVAASFRLHQAPEASVSSEIDPMMRKAGHGGRFGPAADREQHAPPSAAVNGLGDGPRQTPASANDGERRGGRGRCIERHGSALASARRAPMVSGRSPLAAMNSITSAT